MSLSAKERIMLALEGRETDYVPFCPFLAYVWEHFPPDIQQLGQLEFHHAVGADPLWRGAPCPVRAIPPEVETRSFNEGTRAVTMTITPVGTLRQASVQSPTGNTWFLVEHPLKTEADFAVQQWIEEHTRYAFDPAPVREHLIGNGAEGLSIGMLIPRCKSAFQSLVEHHVGTEELIYALADYPDAVESLWRAMVANNLRAVELALEADYDYYLTWEDSGTQNYSPALYERYIAIEIAQWCSRLTHAGKRYIQHACGNLKAILRPMQASGVFAVESISPPPTGDIEIRDARACVGSDFGIIGGIEPTAFLNLSVAELGPYTEQVIADGAGGPFVLANSDSCPPGVTLEKFRRVAEVARGCRVKV